MQISTTPLCSIYSFLRALLDPGVMEEWSENSFLDDIPSLLIVKTFVATNPRNGEVWPWLHFQALLFSFLFSSSSMVYFTSATLLELK